MTTQMGQLQYTSESNLKKLCPNSIVHKGLNIHGSHVGECRQQLERWVGGK